MTNWVLTYDYLADTMVDSDVDVVAMPLRFRLYDGDDILYYEGIGTDIDAVEAAYRYYQVDSGVTSVSVYEDGEWKDV